MLLKATMKKKLNGLYKTLIFYIKTKGQTEKSGLLFLYVGDFYFYFLKVNFQL